ncbi:MAG: aminotransferase class I/II-fold pyridoxal phosphate-dependent enzyme [candidate division Zixibacteria bacterium]|nr:aminotransferase class I/II-fold pyridoxal phosphate-dependent enzyme [candidate division Zixibacteria bacterium]
MNTLLPQVVFEGIVTVRDRLLQMPDPLRLESGDPSFDTPDHVKEAATKALRDNLTHYAPSTGIKPLREAMFAKLQKKNGMTYLKSPDQIFVTAGGMHALYCTFRSILNEGDEVLFQVPNWTATGQIIIAAGGKLNRLKLRPELGYRWDLNELESRITPRTKAVAINTPHNPTGGVMFREDLERLLEIAVKHDLYVVSDEAYEDVIYDTEHVSIASLAERYPKSVQDKIITAFTFSKSFAMSGWRLGYAVCSGEKFSENIKKMILYTANGISTPTQWAGVAALTGPQDCITTMRAAYRERRDLLFAGVNQTDFLRCEVAPQGAFYVYARITPAWNGNAWDLSNYLIDNFSLGAIPGDIFYDDTPSIRFAYACKTDMIRRAIQTLASAGKPARA